MKKRVSAAAVALATILVAESSMAHPDPRPAISQFEDPTGQLEREVLWLGSSSFGLLQASSMPSAADATVKGIANNEPDDQHLLGPKTQFD